MKSHPLPFLAAAVLALSGTLHAQAVPQTAAAAPDRTALTWDADTKEVNPKRGDLAASFNFVVTNVSDHEVMLNKLRTSCGCTVAQLPSAPYKLEPGADVSIAVTLDLRGKSGTLTKTVGVESSAGVKTLVVRANIPQAAPGAPDPVPAADAATDRTGNIQDALADPRAIFKGNCATCHVDKGAGKLGAALYVATCGICHESKHRAAMVPDLKVPRSPRDLAFWQKWIAEGKPGTLMPAFAAAHGGPLTQEQADSLAVFLYQYFPRNSPPSAIAPRTDRSQSVETQTPVTNSTQSSPETP